MIAMDIKWQGNLKKGTTKGSGIKRNNQVGSYKNVHFKLKGSDTLRCFYTHLQQIHIRLTQLAYYHRIREAKRC